MALPKQRDPGSSVAAYFGNELRRYRNFANMTQEQLGQHIGYTGSLIGLIETARRTPSREFAELCDETFGNGGALSRIWPLVGSFPNWFTEFVELEAQATGIQTFEVQLIPGLLQIESYTRALFAATGADDVDANVSIRLERQAILTRPNPPMLWVVIDESVLHRPVGGPEVMRDQLKHVAELASPRIVLQVLPYSVGAHACMDGALTTLAFNHGPDLLYLEIAGVGQLRSDPNEVMECRTRYDLIRAAALSPVESVKVIRAAMEELGS